jgi:hypothetical protein
MNRIAIILGTTFGLIYLYSAASGPGTQAAGTDGPAKLGLGPEAQPGPSRGTPASSPDSWKRLKESCGALNLVFPGGAAAPNHDFKLKYLVTTLPDPEKTNLALFFDRSLESLLWAAGDSGYSFECYSLPWKAGRQVEEGTARAPNSEPSADRSQPGIVVFRKGDNRQELLVMFIAGETPTSGIDRPQFRTALKWLKEAEAEQPFPLVGPTFSGSFTSLLELIAESGAAFKIRNGTATDAMSIQKFRDELKHLPLTSTYDSLIINDQFAGHCLFTYLQSVTFGSSPVAILAEDETTYGRIFENTLAGEMACPGVSMRDTHGSLFLRFPREIARLRNASEDGAVSATMKPGETAGTVPQSLPLNLKDGAQPSDSIAPFSKDQTPISAEAVLLNIAGTLRRERVQYAGIVATDVLDELYLVRYFRQAVPDVRLFLFDADLLFVRAGDVTPMEGVLSVSTYPLFSRNQHWTEQQLKGGYPRRALFPNRYAEGTYNACRSLLLGPQEQLLEYSDPVDRSDLPPLWLTAVGRDSYWPMALLYESDSARNVAGQYVPPGKPSAANPAESFHPENPAWVWFVLFGAAIGASGLVGGLVTFHYLWPVKPFDRIERLLRAFPRFPTTFELPYISAICLVLAGVDLMLGLSLGRFWANWGLIFRGIATIALGMFLLLAMDAALLYFRRQKFEEKPGFAPSYTITAISFLTLFAFAACWIYLCWFAPYRAGIFFAYRDLIPDSGVAPSVPVFILAAAFLHWGWIHLGRALSVRLTKTTLPGAGPFALLREFANRVDDALKPVIHRSWLGMTALLLLFWYIVFWPVRALGNAEPRPYHAMVLVLIVLLHGALASTFLQLRGVWSLFRDFLDQLEKMPFRGAFSRLPKEFASPIWRSIRNENALRFSSRCRDSLAAFLSVAQLDDEARARFTELLEQIRSEIEQFENSAAGSGPPNRALQRQLRQHLAAAADELVRSLDDVWKTGDSDSLSADERRDTKKPLPPQEMARVYAEEFLAVHCLVFIRHVMRNLRNLLMFVVSGYVLAVIAMESYPFQAPRLIGFDALAVFVFLGIGLVALFAGMDRSAILSRITNTKPDELSLDFFKRAALAGALPLVTVLGSQFPSLGRFMSSWLEPAMRALR